MQDLFIKKIDIDKESFPNNKIYPFNIDIIKNFNTINLTKNVTFIVGENGVGKSGESKPSSDEKTQTTANKTSNSTPKAGSAPAKSGEFRNNSGGFEKKGEFRRKYEPGSKKSDNPDVLYGRDFEEEPLEIEKIDTYFLILLASQL